MSDNEESPEKVIQVVSGSPTPEELAAVITVLSKISYDPGPSAIARTDMPRAGGWKSYYRTVRRSHRPGPGAWRTV